MGGKLVTAVRRFFRYEPYDGGVIELFLMRLLFVGMLLWQGEFLWGYLHSNGLFDKFNYREMPVPNGLGHWVDFTWVYHQRDWLEAGLYVASALYVCGVFTLPAIGYILVLAVGLGTLRNSQGHIHHGTQLLALTVLSLFVGYLVGAVRKVAKGGWRLRSSVEEHRFAYVCAVQGIAAYYFVAGVAKIEARGLVRWVEELRNMGLYVDRNGHQQYLAGGSLEDYERSQMIAGWINDHPLLTVLLIAPGLLVELAAPLAVLNRRVAFAIGVVVLVLHVLVGYMMQLSFPMNELVILIFLVNVPFVMAWLLTRGVQAVGLPELPRGWGSGTIKRKGEKNDEGK